jgi:predicted AAA+ superfamily ATPase
MTGQALFEALSDLNPWWSGRAIPQGRLGKPRPRIAGRIRALMPAREMVAITGVRRCGKSTLMHQAIEGLLRDASPKNVFYLSADAPMPYKGTELLDKAYSAFLEANNPKGRKYVFLDEIQTAEGWENWLKSKYDLEGKTLKIVFSGSNSSMLASDRLSMLTGRLLRERVHPLSFAEYLDFKGAGGNLPKEEALHYLGRYLEEGGFPETAADEGADEINRRRLSEYFEGIIFRDVVYSRGVREPAKISELARYAVTNIASPTSLNALSRATGININSLSEYLNYLEDANLVFQHHHFSYSLRQTEAGQKKRKLYCIDAGLRNASSFRFSKDTGRLAENAVFLQMRMLGKEAYFWEGDGEVDFVALGKNGDLQAINVSYSDQVQKRETDALHEFSEKFRRTKRLLLITKDRTGTENGVECIPLHRWLLMKEGEWTR